MNALAHLAISFSSFVGFGAGDAGRDGTRDEEGVGEVGVVAGIEGDIGGEAVLGRVEMEVGGEELAEVEEPMETVEAIEPKESRDPLEGGGDDVDEPKEGGEIGVGLVDVAADGEAKFILPKIEVAGDC